MSRYVEPKPTVEACRHCGHAVEPNFREEVHSSFDTIVRAADAAPGRTLRCRREVLVCRACGEVHVTTRETKC